MVQGQVDVVTEIKPEKDGRSFDIIVPTHNTLENKGLRLTLGCVEALYDNTSIPFHLIVVDDSTDVTPIYFQQLMKQHDNITYVHSDEPYKCGNQLFNIGLSHTKHDFVVTIMNSIRVTPEWELVALEIMKNNPKVGVIGFKCLFPNGLIESAGIRMIKWLPTDIGRDLPGYRLPTVYECDAVQWAFALLRKEAVVGNLEENIFHGFRGWDDIDNCFVVKKNGWKVFYCGLGIAYHEPRATRGNDGKQAYIENQENGQIFYKRWGFWDEFIKENPQGDIHTPPKMM